MAMRLSFNPSKEFTAVLTGGWIRIPTITVQFQPL